MNYRSAFLAFGALALVPQSAMANDTHIDAINGLVTAPAGVSATLGMRVPLGAQQTSQRRPTYGLTVGYGMRFEGNRPLDVVRTRQLEIAQLNFDSDGARDLQLANHSLTQFGRKDVDAQRLNLSTGKTLLVVGGVALAVVALAFLATDDDDFSFVE